MRFSNERSNSGQRVQAGTVAMGLRTFSVAVALLSSVAGAAMAGDNAPVIAVPGKRGVPVIINGRDASWAIVVGDWGLYRPGAVPVTVIYPRRWYPPQRPPICACGRTVRRGRVHSKVMRRAPSTSYVPVAQRHYFPSGAGKPVLGRLEIEPKTPPKRPETVFRSWSTESTPLPADTEAAPQVIVGPSAAAGRRRPHRPRHPPNSPPADRAAAPTPR